MNPRRGRVGGRVLLGDNIGGGAVWLQHSGSSVLEIGLKLDIQISTYANTLPLFVYVYVQVLYMYIQGNPAVFHAPAHRNMIGRSMTATSHSCYRPVVFFHHLCLVAFFFVGYGENRRMFQKYHHHHHRHNYSFL